MSLLQDDRIRIKYKDGTEVEMPNEGLKALKKVAPEVVERMGYEEGGVAIMIAPKKEMKKDSMPEEQEEDMLPDDEMEDEYLDFILDEALDNEEEDFLMDALQGNDRLSMIFDKVIDVAQEFAGSGPVEGPGSGVSDSIPARLSDGEFVFTAKAAKEIGADELMRMMKDAEMRADKRQGMANGGEMEEDTVTVEATDPDMPTQVIRVERPNVGPEASMQEEEDLVKQNIITRGMSGKPSPVS